jgi:hypothetical protein
MREKQTQAKVDLRQLLKESKACSRRRGFFFCRSFKKESMATRTSVG